MSFSEGGVLLAAEILGAKMLAPYFGSSIYVWASVLSATLGGLALGYFFAGRFLSHSTERISWLAWMFTFSGFLVLAMPLVARELLSFLDSYSLIPALLIGSSLLLLPPMFCFGCVSPLIIDGLNKGQDGAGRTSGLVFAMSTLGGIVSSLLIGFYVIPTFGLARPGYFLGVLLMGLAVAGFRERRIWRMVPLFGSLVIIGFIGRSSHPQNVLYLSDGLAGQVLVATYGVNDSSIPQDKVTSIFINRWEEASEGWAHSHGELTYHALLRSLIESSGAKSVLLGGLGSGWLGNELSAKGLNVEAVELDPRIPLVARRFFNLPDSFIVHIEDFRRFIRTTKARYDAIVLDLFTGEEIASHCITREAFVEIKKHLTDKGIIFVNFFGYWDNELGLGAKVLAKTMLEAGLEVEIHSTGETPEPANQIFVAAARLVRMGRPYGRVPNLEELASITAITDDRPAFNYFNRLATLQTRSDSINYFKSKSFKEIPFFY